jgi:hypothetical protein
MKFLIHVLLFSPFLRVVLFDIMMAIVGITDSTFTTLMALHCWISLVSLIMHHYLHNMIDLFIFDNKKITNNWLIVRN